MLFNILLQVCGHANQTSQLKKHLRILKGGQGKMRQRHEYALAVTSLIVFTLPKCVYLLVTEDQTTEGRWGVKEGTDTPLLTDA